MDNPFDDIRKKREAAAALKQQQEEAKRQAEEALKRENERLFRQYCDQYSPMVERILEQLRISLYRSDERMSGPHPLRTYQNSWETPIPNIWRPVWELGHTNLEPISDTGPLTDVWYADVKVTLDFDKKRHPVFVCQHQQSQQVTCPATEADLIRVLSKLHE